MCSLLFSLSLRLGVVCIDLLVLLSFQFDGINHEVMVKIENRSLTIERMKDMPANEIGEMIRHVRYGTKVHAHSRHVSFPMSFSEPFFPLLSLRCQVDFYSHCIP